MVAAWSHNEQNETSVLYLLDGVLDREEAQLGDSLAPDMIDHVKELYVDTIGSEPEPGPRPATRCLGEQVSPTVLIELRESILAGVREIVGL